MSKVQSADDQSQRVEEKPKDIEREEQMKKEIGDIVLLKLSQEEIEEELANMNSLMAVLMLKMDNPQDKKELKKTFDVAITAMEMVWLNMQEEGKEQ